MRKRIIANLPVVRDVKADGFDMMTYMMIYMACLLLVSQELAEWRPERQFNAVRSAAGRRRASCRGTRDLDGLDGQVTNGESRIFLLSPFSPFSFILYSYYGDQLEPWLCHRKSLSHARYMTCLHYRRARSSLLRTSWYGSGRGSSWSQCWGMPRIDPSPGSRSTLSPISGNEHPVNHLLEASMILILFSMCLPFGLGNWVLQVVPHLVVLWCSTLYFCVFVQFPGRDGVDAGPKHAHIVWRVCPDFDIRHCHSWALQLLRTACKCRVLFIIVVNHFLYTIYTHI